MRVIPPTASALLAGCGVLTLCAATPSARAEDDSFLRPGSLLISTSTYDRTQGAVASLTAGTTQLANTNTATVTAVAGNLYPEVWNNASVDGSFGVTSPITLLEIGELSEAQARHHSAQRLRSPSRGKPR